MKFMRVLQHASASIGRNNAERNPLGVEHVILLGESHRARVEGGNLIVIKIGGDKGLPSEGALHATNVLLGKP